MVAVCSSTTLERPTSRPDAQGRYGRFGGKYVPETLVAALAELEEEYNKAMKDPEFQVCHHFYGWTLTPCQLNDILNRRSWRPR